MCTLRVKILEIYVLLNIYVHVTKEGGGSGYLITKSYTCSTNLEETRTKHCFRKHYVKDREDKKACVKILQEA